MNNWNNSPTDGPLAATDADMAYRGKPECSWAELLSGRNLVLSLALTGGVMLDAVDMYITATLLPSVVRDIGGLDYYAWNTTLFVVASIMSAAIAGRILARIGPRAAYAVAGGFFFAGCLIAAMAPNMVSLLAGRILQGVGGGMLLTLCYAMIMMLFPERLWPRAIAMLSGMWGIATICGPAIGGIFAEMGNRRLGFGILLPATALHALFTSLVLPGRRGKSDRGGPLPYPQLLLLAGSALVISIGGTLEDKVSAAGCILLSAAMISLFIRQEKRSENRIFPKGSFDWNSPLFGALMTVGFFCICVNAEVFLPFFLQSLHQLTPLWAGYLSVLIAIGWIIGKLPSARLTGHVADRAISTGPWFILTGMVLLWLSVPGATGFDPLRLAIVAAGLLTAGVGIGIAWPHLNNRIFRHAPPEDAELAASALSSAQMYAIAFGSALSGLIINMARMDQMTESDMRIGESFLSDSVNSGISRGSEWLFTALISVAFICVFSARHRGRPNQDGDSFGNDSFSIPDDSEKSQADS